MSPHDSPLRRLLTMIGLIVAGEAVFALPFHVARFFRPILLDVTGLSATELGAVQGVYGIVAMLAYFAGGPLADHFSARKLLALSLWATAGGGLYLATFPGYAGMALTWGFFGVTSILLFWAALIRATRDWGGVDEQGRAYGFLDGGRGLLAAGMASAGVFTLHLAFPAGYEAADGATRAAALRQIVLGYTIVTALAGLFVWWVIPERRNFREDGGVRQHLFGGVKRALRLPAVWLQAAIVFCAYVGYKGFDHTAVFAVEAWDVDAVDAARIVTLGSWMRVFSPILAGLVGDRIGISRAVFGCFVLLLASHLFFALATPVPDLPWVLTANVLASCVAFFGLRGLYFALMEEARIPATVTGAAVGLISVVGFAPDVFVTWVAGLFVDGTPGVAGHQQFYAFLACFSAAGAVAALLHLRRVD